MKPPRAKPRATSAPIAALLGGFAADSGRYRLVTKVMRAFRRARLLCSPGVLAHLATSPSFQAHTAAEGEGDPVFFLSHRHYLAKGLGSKDRSAAALCHYRHEDQIYVSDYFDRVYRNGGLMLWSADSDGHRYEIVLQPGRDVAYEGGLSVALLADGGCIGVLSFSLVPAALIGQVDGLPDTVHLVCRRHLTKDRAYQAAFNKAFHRAAPAHMIFAALEGVILAQGRKHAVGIAPERHPSDQLALSPYFRSSYTEFWASLGGEVQSKLGTVIDLPMRLSPLDELDSAKRKRALQRRAHLDAIRDSAQERISALLLHRETA